MKKFTKLLGIVLIIALVMSMGTMALAAPADTTLKVSPVDGHTYTAYQLFVGDLAEDKVTLSNVKWGSNVASSIKYYAKATADATTFTVEKTINPVAGNTVPQEVLDYLASLSSKSGTNVAQGTADIISAWVSGTGTTLSAADTTVKTGYYVVKDAYTNPTADQTTTLSTVVCEVVGPTTITPKAGETSHEKKVLDVNDTTETAIDLTNLIGVTEGWDKTADHDWGDHVPFKLTTKIGSDFAKYTNYYLAVSDTLKDGLKLDQDSIKVYVDGTLATEGTGDGEYSLTKADKSFKVEFTKLNGNAKAAAGKDVVIVYTATLDKATAVIGNPGNVNESYAEFSNNPNGDQTGKGKTPTDTAVVFTYKTDVDKITKDGAALTGAGFTLYKKYNAAVDGKENVAGTTPAGAKADTFPTGEFWYAVETISTGTNFEFKAIDDGTYKLVESTTPDGYNTIDPITLTVTATHGADAESTTGYSVSVLNADNTAFKADPKGGQIKFTKVNKDEKTLATGEIYSEVINQSGTVLPSTGGIGTTIFYVVGSILVVAAGVLLITKKRMSREG